MCFFVTTVQNSLLEFTAVTPTDHRGQQRTWTFSLGISPEYKEPAGDGQRPVMGSGSTLTSSLFRGLLKRHHNLFITRSVTHPQLDATFLTNTISRLNFLCTSHFDSSLFFFVSQLPSEPELFSSSAKRSRDWTESEAQSPETSPQNICASNGGS